MKVADLVSGEAVALIALENRRIVGTVDCIVQPAAAPAANVPRQPQKQPNNLAGGGARTTQVITCTQRSSAAGRDGWGDRGSAA